MNLGDLFDKRDKQAEEDRKDAARYRLLRHGQHWSVIDGIGDALRAETLDAAIDMEMTGSKVAG